MSFTLLQKNLTKNYVPKLTNVFKTNKEWDEQNITKGCYLTLNVKDRLPEELIKEITEPFFDSHLLHHLHILKYPPEGVLDYHDHSAFEVWSFVLYMDNVGGTIFKTDQDELFVHSRPNKLIIFDSKIKHKAVNNNQERIVAAGGIIKK